MVGCGPRDQKSAGDDSMAPDEAHADLLEPPSHAPGEPHPFTECPDGVCPREQPAYLFSGEFHESVVDLRVASCGVGLDLVWARRYRSRLTLPDGQTPLGNNWDHSYNIYLHLPAEDADGSSIVIYDGNARPATFVQDQASGAWTAPGYHREGRFDDDGHFVLRFADGGAWVFRSLEDSARADLRRLDRIVDRNGNAVELEYDRADRLQRVVNSSGQSLVLEYDSTGHIAAVVARLDAQTERRVTYERYRPGDPGGGSFDLARVTLPAVVDTVTGNDFPEGTSTIYTYATGTGVRGLDGNLLTITDGLGRVYLRNTYASSTDPDEFEFDHLVNQTWGDADDTISIEYVPVSPNADNGHAVRKAWMNDRLGRVTEHFFNGKNQLVMLREYTGFADPDRPTSGVSNRPREKLRAGDPTYFETRYQYNEDGHVTRVIHPRGDVTRSVYEAELDPDASPRVRGNKREIHREAGECGGELAVISEYLEYAAGLGNEHGEANFVVRAEDPRGNVTLAMYDAAGNRTAVIHPEPNVREDMQFDAAGRLIRELFPEDQHGHRREVVHVYEGRRRTSIVDPQGLALTTVSEYDAACNEVRRVDPRGNDTLYTHNQRDQVIRELGPLESCAEACGGGVPVRAYTDRHYDANMNLVRVDYEARNCDGTVQGDGVVSTHYEYDVLGELIATRVALGDGSELVNEIVLDANREPVVLRYGEAAAGADPFNTSTTVYDERGHIFRESRGAGSEVMSTVQHDYDANGNEIAMIEGLEGAVQATTHTFDCANRMIATVDPMGNRTELDYDPAGNVIESRLYGELVDVPGDAQNTLLERETVVYDAMNRATATARAHFNPVTRAPIGDGESTTVVAYDGESRVIREVDGNGNEIAHEFDAAGRRRKTVDANGNITEQVFDATGNVIAQIQTDVASDGGESQVRAWTHTYNAHNDRVTSTDPLGNESLTCYDSLGQVGAEIDARGNRTTHIYDEAGRLLETHHWLTDNGSGDGMVLGAAVVRQVWDGSDRLIAREDPNGNVTRYEYDSLNRVVAEIFADGTAVWSSYDVHDNLAARRDPNGTTLTHSYDGLNRLIEVAVAPGPGVDDGTTFERYAYDGRSLLVSASDDDSVVLRAYDSLAGLISETQTLVLEKQAPVSRTVAYVRDGLGNPTLTIYPSGLEIGRSFDGARRTTLLREDGQALVRVEYLGADRIRKHVLPLGLQSEYTFDADRRMVSSRHSIAGELVDAREYEYDAAGNKRLDRDRSPNGVSGVHQVAHDSLGRSTHSEVTGSVAADRSVAYGFDGAGNRTLVSGDHCSGVYSQIVNQYMSTPCEEWSHDAAGNLLGTTSLGGHGLSRQFSFDHRDRLVGVMVAGAKPHRFAYDVLGRKIRAWQEPDDGVDYVYDDWNVIEEYAHEGKLAAATYLYGDGLDDRLGMRRGDASWWYLDDDLGSAVALVHRTQDAQLTVERYAYTDYGEPQIFVDDELAPASIAGNPYLFAGRQWLADLRLYDFRTRHFDPVSGRFISRDRLGIWGDEENLGNGYTYVGNMPESHTDPTGEFKKPNVKNCHAGAQSQIEGVMRYAEPMAQRGRDWFAAQAKRNRGPRKKDWNRANHDGSKWWGIYNNTRFNRIKNNFGKITRRCRRNVITFKCRTTGRICGRKKASAWTHSFWHAQIRLCKYDDGGFYKSNGDLARAASKLATTAVHEIAHNINAIGDKKVNGSKVYSISSVQRLAKEKPGVASWNAANYDKFADAR